MLSLRFPYIQRKTSSPKDSIKISLYNKTLSEIKVPMGCPLIFSEYDHLLWLFIAMSLAILKKIILSI